MSLRQLEGKKVVITGGSRGLGYATAEMSLDHGAEVVIASRDAKVCEASAKRLSERVGREVRWQALDGTDRAATAAFLAAHAPFDHLVLPGSQVYRTHFDDMDEQAARQFFDSKFWGPFWAAYEGRRHMRRGGSVVLYSGAANRRPLAGYVMGAAIDGAVDAITRSLAWEFSRDGLRVNCISPGIVETDVTRLNRTEEQYREWRRHHEGRLPLGRLGRPEECARGALYLMTNGFVTGEILCIDGGVECIP